jgi:hypothetical protein
MQTVLLCLVVVVAADHPPLSSGLQILKLMPEHLRPHPVSGWDSADEAERQAWFKTAAAGERWESRCKVVSVRVERFSGFQEASRPVKPWLVHVVCEPVKYTFAGTKVTESRSVRLEYDEDPSKMWKGVRAGHVLKVSGTVKGTKFEGSALFGSFFVYVDGLAVAGESFR